LAGLRARFAMPVELVRDALDLGLGELVEGQVAEFFDKRLQEIGFALVGVVLDVKQNRVSESCVGAVGLTIGARGFVVVGL